MLTLGQVWCSCWCQSNKKNQESSIKTCILGPHPSSNKLAKHRFNFKEPKDCGKRIWEPNVFINILKIKIKYFSRFTYFWSQFKGSVPLSFKILYTLSQEMLYYQCYLWHKGYMKTRKLTTLSWKLSWKHLTQCEKTGKFNQYVAYIFPFIALWVF